MSKHQCGASFCSILAIATALMTGASPAAAQALQGTVTSKVGVGEITTGPGTTNIPVVAPQAVINWTTTGTSNGGVTTFSDADSTATFSGTQNFAVLNRVTPATIGNAILMNGNINSLVGNQVGGTVYFYSPNGIIIGGDASINVGSFGLTTLPIADTQGVWMSDFGGAAPQVIFGPATNAASVVRTAPGSSLTALNQGSYIAMVAPLVVHDGAINVNGSAALVAAEAATLTFRTNGLFDIQVTAGSTDFNGVVTNGAITGPASSGAGDHHRAYLVAVPKNDAMTMLIQQGSLGFDIAGAANVVGNAVVLSAGHDVFGDTIGASPSAGNRGFANLLVSDTDFTSRVDAAATDSGNFFAVATTAQMASSLHLRAADAGFFAINDGILQVSGSVTLDTSNRGVPLSGPSGGTAFANAGLGGRINIAGNLTLLAQGVSTSSGATGTGGSVNMIVDGGSIVVGGALKFNADGRGGAGATGQGGVVDVVAGPDASTISAGSFEASADGFGGVDTGTGSGDGFGGGVLILASGAGANIAFGNASQAGGGNARQLLSADGLGGSTNGGGDGAGGTGQGGFIFVESLNGGSIQLPNSPIVSLIGARGIGGDANGDGTTGGLGLGGTMDIAVDGGTLTGGNLFFSAYGWGGSANGTGNINGGNGIGGVRNISAMNGGTMSLSIPGGTSSGIGGDASGTGRGGNGSGASASLIVDNATVNFTSRSIILTQNSGGQGAIGGDASGGIASVTVRNGGTINVAEDPAVSNDLVIGSYAFGGGTFVGTGTRGGNAVAGTSTLLVEGGTVNGGRIVVVADAYGGGDLVAVGGDGRGGSAVVRLNGGTIASSSLRVSAVGNGAGISLDGTGGAGTGGSALLEGQGINTLTLADLTIDASGIGGGLFGPGGTGGTGQGGSAALTALAGSATSLNASVTIRADGTGGGTNVESAGSGGIGNGGNASLSATSAALTVTGSATLDANGRGESGNGSAGNGGSAEGGDASIVAANGATLKLGPTFLNAFATGGAGREGGAALGGHGTILSNLSVIEINGGANVFVGATGGTGQGANGGSATGGQFELVADGGTLGLGGFANLAANALGGDTDGTTSIGGAGVGGGLQVQARNGGTLTLSFGLLANSDGQGGAAPAVGARAGDGHGGTVDVAAFGANSTLDARGFVTLSAQGIGGVAVCGECGIGGAGGNGTGGNAFVHTFGGNGNEVMVANSLSVSALGQGSSGFGGASGNGQGGMASVSLANDGQITIGGALDLLARGEGGSHAQGGAAGSGTGGDASINLAGNANSLLAVGANPLLETSRLTTLDSGAVGGTVGAFPAGNGGAATGGWSRIYGTGGTATFAGNVQIRAGAQGGGTNGGGAGGAATGGRARLNADGATYRIDGSASITTDATGGTGHHGGAATQRNSATENNAGIFANNGGSIRVVGATTLSADSRGGNGSGTGGNGGSASAGSASIVASGSSLGNGIIGLAGTEVSAFAIGGAGSAGGAGGNATGGLAELYVVNSASGTNRLTTGAVHVDASAQGGRGGRGADGASGTAGGAGGNATGGSAIALAGAGNGAMQLGNLQIFATGRAGHGGGGGNGSSGIGGAGGAGGTGDGGSVQVGVVSGAATATTNGTFDATSVLGWADSYGGDGGFGGTGTTGAGNGGNGGDALSSFNALYARGGRVTIGRARLLVDTQGGDGGAGAVQGNGGTAYTPDIAVLVTNRFEQPGAGGTLNVDDLYFYSIALRGEGATPGQAIASGGPRLLVENSTARFGSFVMTSTAGDGINPDSFTDYLRILNGSVTVTNGFRFDTDHRLSVMLDRGSLTAGGPVTLEAVDFERDSSVTPTALGTISGGSFNLASGGALILDANLASGSSLAVDVPGAIAIGNVTAAGAVDLESAGALSIGNVTGGERISLIAEGALRAGNLSAGLVNNQVRAGAEYNIGILARTSVAVGNASARDWIGIGSFGGLTAGNITSRNDVLLAADGAVNTGALTTGPESRLLIAGAGMIALGGPIDAFDRGRLFDALFTPAERATGGSVTIGAVSTGRMDALVGGNATLGAMTFATSSGRVEAGGLLTLTGSIAGSVDLTSNDIDVAEGISIGEAQLVSRNAQGTFVGDGLAGEGGYRLSNAEFGRFGELEVAADTARGAAPMMTIGDLTIDNAGLREIDFTVGDYMAETDAGVIRVVGDVRFNGAVDVSAGEDGTDLDFSSSRFELDSATGSIALLNDSGGVDGSISINAQQVWIADSPVLARLAADPTYAGLAADLAAPSSASAPGGVIRAGDIDIFLSRPDGQTTGPAYSVFVQNTGSAATPAGFTAREASVSTDEANPPLIDLNVYGQIVTPGGTLTGVAVRDALMAEDDPARFTAQSRINGCALAGPCGAIIPEPPQRPPVDPQPAISTEISLLTAPKGDDVMFGNEEAIEDNEEEGGEDSKSSPISPPSPLFNTKPLEPKSDTDEPVSGGGNPALIGTGPVEGEK